jgi:signal transduction histidine kinase
MDLGETEERLRISIDHLLEGVQVIGRDWTYLYLNQTAVQQAQQPADYLLGRTMTACYPGIETTEMFARLRAVMEGGKADRLRNPFTFPSGERRWFDLIVEPVPDGICIISLDVTDQLRLEAELHHAQKMEAIGQLAGGIAHDFNNQLTVIVGLAELLLTELDPSSRAHRDVQEIKDAGERSASLTRQLLAFSRRQVLAVRPIDVNTIVTDAGRFLERLLGADIDMALRLDPSVGPILGDPAQLENVLANLVVNARDAMPTGGRLTIASSVVLLTEDDAAQHAALTPGRYVVLSVVDSGHGMDEGTKARMFEPFFTTKAAGKGTGLGLATVYGVIRQMGGFIWVYSEVGHGSTFRLYFPATDERPDDRPAVADPAGIARRAAILVVEDEAAVRAFTVRALRSRGHHVIEAGSIAEASAPAAGNPAIELAVIDVVLPDGVGSEVVSHLPSSCRVIFVSGYSDRHVRDPGFEPGTILVEKPFTIDALLRAVNRALADA